MLFTKQQIAAIAKFLGLPITKAETLFSSDATKRMPINYDFSSWEWLIHIVEVIEEKGYVFFIVGAGVEIKTTSILGRNSIFQIRRSTKKEAIAEGILFFIDAYNAKKL